MAEAPRVHHEEEIPSTSGDRYDALPVGSWKHGTGGGHPSPACVGSLDHRGRVNGLVSGVEGGSDPHQPGLWAGDDDRSEDDRLAGRVRVVAREGWSNCNGRAEASETGGSLGGDDSPFTRDSR